LAVTCTETASITEQQGPGLIRASKTNKLQLVAGADKQNESAKNVYEYKQERGEQHKRGGGTQTCQT
jgi:hypothetical protein